MQKVFRSSAQTKGYPGYPERSGETVDVKPLDPRTYDEECGEMFRITFADGAETVAYQDELS